ncbi:MAG: ABC transporter permease [Opitutae bacterium]|nr:ABC transporter permease [Opitutae bacterium]
MQIFASALRQLRAQPFFSALVILLLAVGLGANTAIFGVVHAVLLKPLPYPEPGNLVMVRKVQAPGSAAAVPGGGDSMPDSEFLGWTEAVPKSFRALAAYRSTTSALQRAEGAVRVPSAAVTGEFFSLLGVTAWRGRLFSAADQKPGAAPTTVLSYSAWQTRYQGDDRAVGQIAQIDDVAHTIIGVLPPAFEFVDPVQFWRPLPIAPSAPGQLRIQLVRVFGRLRPGTARDSAQRELDGLSDRFWNNLAASFGGPGPQGGDQPGERRVVGRPDGASSANAGPALVAAPSANGPARQDAPAPAGQSVGPARQVSVGGPGGPGGGGGLRLPFADSKVQLVTLQEQLAKQSRTTLWLLLGAVGFVLLIACANIASLQLARAAGRRRDAAVRATLGASPARLAAELLAENALLALLGGAGGVLLAWWGTRALQAGLADFLPRVAPVAVNLPVLAFAALLALVTGLGFGLAPAWQGSRVDLTEALKEGGPQSSPSSHRWRQALVAFEVALALVLAVNTGLLAKSIYRLYATELGYRTADVLTANLSLPRRYGTPAQQRAFADRWLDALRALPGVRVAALTDLPPLSPYTQLVLTANLAGATGNANASVNSAPPAMAVANASPEFFRAAGIALRQGRAFTAADGPGAPNVAIVNESFVKTFYPRGFTLGAPVNLPFPGDGHGPPPTAAIVGVVADVRPRGFDDKAQPLAYFPLAKQPRPRLSAVLHFTGEAAPLARAVTAATHQIDAGLALDLPQTLEQQLARQTAPRRATLALTGAFAATAVLLAALGIFGVMSYTVTQRTREIGVRLALGADRGIILRWILRYGGAAIATGLAVGLALTLASGRLLTTFLVGTTALDPAVLALGVLALAAVGLLACLLPALRAARTDPMVALRTE